MRFQIRNSKQETTNFSGKDDSEYVLTNMKNNLAVSRWYVIDTFSASFFSVLSISFVPTNTSYVTKGDSHIFFFPIYTYSEDFKNYTLSLSNNSSL